MADAEELVRLHAGGPELLDRLAPAKAPPQDGSIADVTAHEVAELKDRLGTALEEIGKLQARNSELEEQCTSLQTDASPSLADQVQGFDWETQKQRLLAQLDGDDGPCEGQQSTDRLKVEEAIRITEQIVAERDREIRDLKNLLQEQASNVGDLAVGAASVSDILDRDELIAQERDSLRLIQEEWREKLRKAEIEISTERARLARERNELEQRVVALEKCQAKNAKVEPGAEPAKPARGHWLARLGLMDADEF